MFKHPKSEANLPDKKEEPSADLPEKVEPPLLVVPEKKIKEVNLSTVQELLEKNLKWSQIIYEQNRRINHKLLWSAAANWIRLLIILVPIILGLIFLPPLVRGLTDKYAGWFSGAKSDQPNSSSFEEFLKLLPVSPDQKEQLKAILK